MLLLILAGRFPEARYVGMIQNKSNLAGKENQKRRNERRKREKEERRICLDVGPGSDTEVVSREERIRVKTTF